MTADHDAAVSTEYNSHYERRKAKVEIATSLALLAMTRDFAGLLKGAFVGVYSSSLLFRFLASRSFAALLLFSQVSA